MAGRKRLPARSIPERDEPELLPPAVADDVIEEVYEEIRGIQRDALVGTAIRIGKLIIDRFYDGDVSAWRDRGRKDASFRRLEAKFDRIDDGTGISAAGLYRAVAIYELDERFGVAQRKHLTVTHLRALLGLPEASQQLLLDQAEEHEWTTTQLEAKAKKVRKKEGDGRGRPPLPAFLKTTNLLGKLALREDAFADLEQVDELDDEEAQDAMRSVTGMRERLDELEGKLMARLKRNG